LPFGVQQQSKMKVAVVVPAVNEAGSLPKVLAGIPRDAADCVVVSDNGSTDGTADVARSLGAIVVSEERRGYGFACWAGVSRVIDHCDVVAFMDAAYKEDPAELPIVLAPILENRADFVLGSRVRYAAKGALRPAQRFGNWLTAQLMRRLYDVRVTDLTSFRAIRAPLLKRLDMQERTYGWPTEMIVKAARAGGRIAEVDVHYRPRYAGKSKVSGTIKGSLMAGVVILQTTFRYVKWRPEAAAKDTKARQEMS
jgi:glycosyltransferase involved in cell wall biosynthesis